MDKTRKKTNSSRARKNKKPVAEKSKNSANKIKVSQSRKKKLIISPSVTSNPQARRTQSVVAMKSAGVASSTATQSLIDPRDTTTPSPDTHSNPANNVTKKKEEAKKTKESPKTKKKEPQPATDRKVDATQEDAPAAPAPAPSAPSAPPPPAAVVPPPVAPIAPVAPVAPSKPKEPTTSTNEPSSGLEVLAVKEDASKPPPKMDDGYEDFGPGAAN